MDFKILTPSDELWNTIKSYAENCSWKAGKALANSMETNAFTDFERVIGAFCNGTPCGFCTVAKTDCIPNVSYTPYIGFMFVDEAYRGNRLSQKLILFAMEYLKSVGFNKVYLVSDHINLYKKYGFKVIDRKKSFWGSEEKIYMQEI